MDCIGAGRKPETRKRCRRSLQIAGLLPCLLGIGAASGYAQVSKPYVEEVLAQPSRDVPSREYQLQEFVLKSIPQLPTPTTPALWSAEEDRVRKHVLNDIAYHGWPREWVDAAPKFEEVGIIETSHGYRIHKLRFEVVPGFHSTALLYEPAKISGHVPAILNLLGHEPDGIAVEYEQKRCINFAKRGIIALDVEFIGF
jgi:hypothetical protein